MITTPLSLIRFRPELDSWLHAAQHLLRQGTPPSSVEWIDCTESDRLTLLPELPPTRWNEAFLTLARRAACHRSSDRWPLLYRVLWRLVHGQSRLLNDALDPDINRLNAFAREVDKEVRHLVASASFTPVETANGIVQVATFRPRHHIVDLAAPLLARQWGDTPWSLLTPERCVAWNGHQLVFTAGTEPHANDLPSATETRTAARRSVVPFLPHRTPPENQQRRTSTPRQLDLL